MERDAAHPRKIVEQHARRAAASRARTARRRMRRSPSSRRVAKKERRHDERGGEAALEGAAREAHGIGERSGAGARHRPLHRQAARRDRLHEPHPLIAAPNDIASPVVPSRLIPSQPRCRSSRSMRSRARDVGPKLCVDRRQDRRPNAARSRRSSRERAPSLRKNASVRGAFGQAAHQIRKPVLAVRDREPHAIAALDEARASGVAMP